MYFIKEKMTEHTEGFYKKMGVCKVCHYFTPKTPELLANGREKIICNNCGTYVIIDKDGNEITDEQLKSEQKTWE